MSKTKQEILLSKIADVQIFKLGTTANEINSFCELIHEAMQIYADQELIEAQRWIPVEDELPTCLESGNWDGLRSYFCLVKFQDESIDIARMYKGKMDGFEFQDWYDKIDFDFGSSIITHWRPIEYPIL